MSEYDARKWLSEDCLGVAWIEIREGLKILERKAAAWDSLYKEMVHAWLGPNSHENFWKASVANKMYEMMNPQEKTPLKELEEFVESLPPCKNNMGTILLKIRELMDKK
jgi:hypothetical protein